MPETKTLSASIVNSFFEVIILIFSVWTLLAQGAMLLGTSLYLLSIAFTLVMPLILSIYVFLIKRCASHRHGPDYKAIVVISSLALIGGALSLVALRGDWDDVHYISRVVYYLDNLDSPMDYIFRNFVIGDLGAKVFDVPLLITSDMEFLWAYAALLTNQDFLNVYHFFVPALGGIMIPLAWYLLYTKFTENTWSAALATTAVIIFLCVDGPTHRSYGNFAFVRIWESKVLLMAVFVPLFAAFSVDFFRDRSRWNFIRLYLLGVCTTGLSSTALFLIPVLSLCLAAGYVLTDKHNVANFRILAIYFLSQLHLVLIAIYCYPYAKISGTYQFVWGNLSNTTLAGVFDSVFYGIYSYVTGVFIISAILSFILLKGWNRRFLAGWFACIFILFLNPLPQISALVAERLTSTSTYWRLAYITPFPFMVGLPVMAISEKKGVFNKFACVLICLFVGFAVFANIRPNNYAVFNRIELGLFKYKIYGGKRIEADVRRIMEKVPDGPMAAPLKYSGVIPLFTSRMSQFVVRDAELLHFSTIHGKADIADKRMRAIYFISANSTSGFDQFRGISGNDTDCFEQFRDMLKTGVRSVIIDPKIKDIPRVKEAFAENHFILLDETDTYTAYVHR